MGMVSSFYNAAAILFHSLPVECACYIPHPYISLQIQHLFYSNAGKHIDKANTPHLQTKPCLELILCDSQTEEVSLPKEVRHPSLFVIPQKFHNHTGQALKENVCLFICWN